MKIILTRGYIFRSFRMAYVSLHQPHVQYIVEYIAKYIVEYIAKYIVKLMTTKYKR